MTGLSFSEARRRLSQHGPNALPEKPPEPGFRRFLRQFQSPLIYILLLALALEVGLWLHEGGKGVPLEALAILAILLLNATLGYLQEKRSEEALKRLKSLAQPMVWVLREGGLHRIPAREVVPGDILRLEAGDRVAADGRILQGSLLVDESVLTGESVPVEKTLGDEVYAGTLVARGWAFVEVSRTGRESAMGRIAGLLSEMEEEKTPLERRMEAFGRRVALWVLLLAAALVVLVSLAEGPSPRALLFAVALAVAAVPEGLPAVLTLALALGVERMARRKAVVRRLAAVEALGSVTLIATDKTGTLTENRMEVAALEASDEEKALLALVLCNDADLETGAGDPLELGLLRYAASRGLDVEALRSAHPRLSEHPFDSAWKYMRVTTPSGSFLKGAPEALIPRLALSEEEKARLLERAEAHAREGYRVLALAWGEGEREEGLSFLGFVLLLDPPRLEVKEAMAQAQRAGIRVVMVTGDHPATALAVARKVGLPAEVVATGEDLDGLSDPELLEVDVFARVRPEQKLRIVEAFQKAGEVVAMTGDGVNDAPALKRADVGVAMGQRGSDVSREVADLVLLDDNFATIVAAIEEGRNIYENIRKFLRFLFSTNLSEVLVVSLGLVFAWALGLRGEGGALLLPLTAVQILWINLVTDGLPALALALDRNPGVLLRPPRPKDEPLLDARSLRFILLTGSLKALFGLGLLGALSRLLPLEEARSALFHYMAIGQLFFAYAARHTDLYPRPNPYLHAAVGLGVAFQVLAGTFFPALFQAVALGWDHFALVLGLALLVWLLAEGVDRVLWRKEAR
jgi:Ca2+-transporting ATPase